MGWWSGREGSWDGKVRSMQAVTSFWSSDLRHTKVDLLGRI